MGRNVSLADSGLPLDRVASEFVKSNPLDRDLVRLFLRENFTDGDGDETGVEALRGLMRRQVEYMRARQAAGDFPDDLDPAHPLLILISATSATSATTAFPRVARAISGRDLASEEFTEAYAEQLGRLLRHLR